MGRYALKPLLAVLALFAVFTYTSFFMSHRKDVHVQVSTTDVTDGQKMSSFMAQSRRMHKVCSKLPEKRQLVIPLKGRLLYISEKYRLSYCRVAKVGSTFWTQIFMELAGVKPQYDEDGEIKSVFDIPRIETHKTIKEHANLTMEFKDTRLRNTTSFLVARNPYSRLFSSYIDQVFLPTKWKNAGKMKKDKAHSECGNDVTFEEFLIFITSFILSGIEVDLHWAPIYSICLPCQSNIDLLAKQETFNDDAGEILDSVGVPKTVIDNVKKAGTEHLIDSSIHTLLHHYIIRGHQAQTGCITETQLAQKLWTAFQIQGYIHNSNTFPAKLFKNVRANATEQVLLDAIIKAGRRKPITLEERSAQREQWKLWFWKNVSNDTVKLVQSAFFEDFLVFDYDMDINKM